MSVSTTEMLAGIPLFSLLDDSERTVLAERIDAVRFEAGEILFERGDPGESMYVVRSGRVEIFITNDTGHTVMLEQPGPGEFFGETSLLDGGPRTASARAVEGTDALVVDREDLFELFHLCPPAALDMLTATGKRLRENAGLKRLFLHASTLSFALDRGKTPYILSAPLAPELATVLDRLAS